MVPIYDSDIAEDRWSKAEWSHYELWEKVDQRIRKHNRLWIAATAVVFLLLSSVPVIMDQRPKWKSLRATRVLGQEIIRIKREAAVNRRAYRLRFLGGGSLEYQVETANRCEDAVFTPVRSGSLTGSGDGVLVLLSKEKGGELNVPGLLESYCYDSLSGGASATDKIAAFAVIPVNDLSVGRLDRLSVLLLSGASTDLSFE
ncbi:MAG: hypothetical protein P4M08_11675 [Oligoflexia bacterium]|nr:hypothetical protein [Oligoflexia bacterium]